MKLSLGATFKRLTAKKKQKKQKQDVVHKFLPIMLKMSILSTYCALSTASLAAGLWEAYPSLAALLDSTINGVCVYLSFGFTKSIYEVLCLPILVCRNCGDYVTVVKEANRRERDPTYEPEQSVLG